MNRGFRPRAILLALAVVLASLACAPPPSTSTSEPDRPARDASSSPKAKRIVVAMMGQPTSFVARMNGTSNTVPGVVNLQQLVNGSLSEQTKDHSLQAQLGEAVPSIDNGLWKLFPDGRMETTWRIKEGARWHDGTPLTADDLLFTTVVDQNKDVPTLQGAVAASGYTWIDEVKVVDPRTIRVTWSQPYVEAAWMFTADFASPLPKHLLGDSFAGDITRFINSTYWGQDYIGAGPFSVRDWVPGAYIRLSAYEPYPLGRPKLDEIEVRFIPDIDTLVTNLIAGSVDLTLGRGFTAEAALQIKDQLPSAKMDIDLASYISAMPQFVNPNPAIVAQAEFRRALWYGVERQQLVDSLEGGLGGVADTYIGPAYAERAAVERSVVKYPYDPRRAAQIIDGLGYRRGTDGAYRDATGDRLTVELRSHGSPIGEKTVVAVADIWTRLGVTTDPVLVLESQMRDRQYAATFPGLSVMKQNDAPNQIGRFHSRQALMPETKFIGTNYPRYINPDFDLMIERYSLTIPLEERLQVLSQIVRFMSENAIILTLFYDPDITVMSGRLQNTGAWAGNIWDVPTWDVSS